MKWLCPFSALGVTFRLQLLNISLNTFRSSAAVGFMESTENGVHGPSPANLKKDSMDVAQDDTFLASKASKAAFMLETSSSRALSSSFSLVDSTSLEVASASSECSSETFGSSLD